MDAVYLVFETLRGQEDCCTATSLGLTCRSFYRVLKEFYPKPINLRDEYATQPNIGQSWRWPLGYVRLIDLVGEFFPGRYRQAAWRNCTPFLSRDIYGDEGGTAEMKLMERYMDYSRMTYDDENASQSMRLLPSPFGLGDDWYIEAQKAEDLGSVEWTDKMWSRWRTTCAYQRLHPIDDALTEWIAMTGL
jgi:hypothetical protein